MAEALYRAGHSTRQIRYLIKRATRGSPPSDATLRHWRRHMESTSPDQQTTIFADIIGRLTEEDLTNYFMSGMEVIAQASERRLGKQEILELVVLTLIARVLELPRLEAVATSLADQWEAHAILRERLPKESPEVHVALSYLRQIERQVGPEALDRAWMLKTEDDTDEQT
jgi:hypothetical protein